MRIPILLLLLVLFLIVVQPILSQTGDESLVGEVVLQNGNKLVLHDFQLAHGPIQATIGNVQTKILLEQIASINVQTLGPRVIDEVKLTLIPTQGGDALYVTREGFDHICGIILQERQSYRFNTRLSLCKSINLKKDSLPRFEEIRPARFSCTVTSSSDTSLELTDVHCFTTQSTETGYFRYIGGLRVGDPDIDQILSPTGYLDLLTMDGVFEVPLDKVTSVDFDSASLVLNSGTKVLLAKKGKTPFANTDGIIVNEGGPIDAFPAISGWNGPDYVAIQSADVKKITAVRFVAFDKPKEPTEASDAGRLLKKVDLVDKDGKTHTLNSVHMETVYKKISMGRILMNHLRPNWYVTGSGQFQGLAIRSEFSEKFAVKVDGFWRFIPLSQVKKVTCSKKMNTLLLRDGATMSWQEIELGNIIGKSQWGDVQFRFRDVASIEILE